MVMMTVMEHLIQLCVGFVLFAGEGVGEGEKDDGGE